MSQLVNGGESVTTEYDMKSTSLRVHDEYDMAPGDQCSTLRPMEKIIRP